MTTDPMAIGHTQGTEAERVFRDGLVGMRDADELGYAPRILELGTKRSDPEFPTHHREWLPDGRWTMADIEHGLDVDVVADAHDLPSSFAAAHGLADIAGFDAVIAVSVWEHLERPWVAAESVADVLAPGGWVYVATHQTFPLHGYPSDFFRFSREALALIFDDAGFEVLATSYAYRCTIVPPPEVTRWNRAPDVEAWLNVDLVGRRRP
jgi:SAM-dependent methyltransferase